VSLVPHLLVDVFEQPQGLEEPDPYEAFSDLGDDDEPG
jgi:hypothetical protein